MGLGGLGVAQWFSKRIHEAIDNRLERIRTRRERRANERLAEAGEPDDQPKYSTPEEYLRNLEQRTDH